MRKMERIIRAIAGSFVTISLILGYFYSPWWYLFTLFVGLNLFQSAFTQWCLAEEILKKFGIGVPALQTRAQPPNPQNKSKGSNHECTYYSNQKL